MLPLSIRQLLCILEEVSLLTTSVDLASHRPLVFQWLLHLSTGSGEHLSEGHASDRSLGPQEDSLDRFVSLGGTHEYQASGHRETQVQRPLVQPVPAISGAHRMCQVAIYIS